MKITIEFNTDNAVFKDVGIDTEIGYTLDRAKQILRNSSGNGQFKLHDTNGNTIGFIKVTN